MKYSKIIYVLITVLFASCYGVDKADKPDNLISEDKMVDVLIELSLISSAKGINKRELENNGIVPELFVYKKHNIDSLQFVNSNNYYAYDIEKYTEIYNKVKDSLERLRTFHKAEEKRKEEEKLKKLKREVRPTKNDSSKLSTNRVQSN